MKDRSSFFKKGMDVLGKRPLSAQFLWLLVLVPRVLLVTANAESKLNAEIRSSHAFRWNASTHSVLDEAPTVKLKELDLAGCHSVTFE